MRKMRTPEMDVVRFKEVDVLAASSLTLSGFVNNNTNDGKMSFGSSTYSSSQFGSDDFQSAVDKAFGAGKKSNYKLITSHDYNTYTASYKTYDGMGIPYGEDGVYKYDSSKEAFVFVRKS